MDKIIFSIPSDYPVAKVLAQKLKIATGSVEIREFPDHETYLRIDSDVKNKIIFLVCSLDHPNTKVMPLMFMAKTLKKLGAKKVCLISPYLSYMRQDKQFKSGEAVTAIFFAEFLASFIDNLITIDPHLHRIKNINEVYSIPAIVLHAKQPITEWIRHNVKSPLIIGPDEESAQWVIEVANNLNAPYAIAQKIRQGDKKVTVVVPDIKNNNNTPILVDDIISTGISMCTVIQQLLSKKFNKPICIGVHALFNQDTYENLLAAGAQEVVSCNTIMHPSNKIDISNLLIEGIMQC